MGADDQGSMNGNRLLSGAPPPGGVESFRAWELEDPRDYPVFERKPAPGWVFLDALRSWVPGAVGVRGGAPGPVGWNLAPVFEELHGAAGDPERWPEVYTPPGIDPADVARELGEALGRARDAYEAECLRQAEELDAAREALQARPSQGSLPSADTLSALGAFSRPREPAPPSAPEASAETSPEPGAEPAKPEPPPVSEELRKELGGNTWGARAKDLAARLGRRVSGEEHPIKTPWLPLDEAMGGGLWSGMHFLVGGTGTGKSQWAMQCAVHAAAHKVPVLYIALELDELGLFARAVSFVSAANDTWLPWSKLYTGRESVPDYAVEALEALPFHWVVAPPHGWPYSALEPSVRALRALHPEHTGTVLVVLDFLQLVAGAPREDLRERIGKAAYQARAVARDLDAAVLVLSSTARQNYNQARVVGAEEDEDGKLRDSKGRFAPDLPNPVELVGLGKESGDVEYAADSVLVLCPQTYPEGEAPPPEGKRVHLAIAKLRAGVPSWVTFGFNGTWFREVTFNPEDEPETIPGEGSRRGKGRKGGGRYGNGRPQQSEPEPEGGF